MSLMQKIMFSLIKRGQKPYDPSQPHDYAVKRVAEEKGVPQKLPKGIMSREVELDGTDGEYLFSDHNPKDRCILYIHGGGFVTGSTKTVRPLTGELVKQTGCNLYSIRYRLAPEHPFPAAPEDCFRAYCALAEKYDGEGIAVIGESAGATLTLATVLRAKDEGIPLPACTVVLAPAVQFDQEFPSHRENLATDCMVSNLSEEVRATYLVTGDPAVLHNPYAAPYYGNYKGFPPTLIIASDSEVLRDDSVFLHQKMKKAGAESRIHLYPGMMHIFPVAPSLPESRQALREIGEFVREKQKSHLQEKTGGADK
ncbi:MAG TPA: alpha/beta hydrolase [Candidatus Mediterraneibacter intestinavium]|nr:alpha/beta hydrolase [Candidatus Mediterraneibacter intestinavium]